jgi:peptidoglycan/xylan/chitin deacetylase (PgdA/CDA1 family)
LVSGTAGEHRVALTFDDGPNPPYTERVLDVLRREHAHATFFVVGEAVQRHPATARRIVAEGNEIGNHSWDHAHLIALDSAGIRAQLQRTGDAIFAATGRRASLMRPPFGQRDFDVLHQAHALGYRVVMWSVPLADDWEQPGADAIAQRVLSRVRDGDIIVLHDGNRGAPCTAQRPERCDRSQDVVATATIVEGLRARGLALVTVDQLMRNGAR